MVGIAPRWWPAPGSRAVAMAAIAALSVAAPVEPAVAAEAPRIGVELPSGASMGDRVPLRVTVPPLGTGAVRVGIDLSSGLRPLGLPAGCAFIGQTWTIACTVEAGDGWEADLPLLTTATGFPGVDVSLLGDRRNDATQGSASMAVDLPEVVRRYAPELRFAAQELAWPTSVERFLDGAELRFAHDAGCPDARVLERGAVTPEVLGRPGGGKDASWPVAPGESCAATGDIWSAIEDTRPAGRDLDAGGQDGFYQVPRDRGSLEGFFLDLDQATQKGLAPTRGAVTYDGGAPIYVQYRAPSQERGDGFIRYWVLYGCSSLASGIDDPRPPDLEYSCWHEGDWEGVAVRLDHATGLASQIAYFAHEEEPAIRAFAPDAEPTHVQVEVVSFAEGGTPTHPVVYVGAGTHASRTRAGGVEACHDFPSLPERFRHQCGTDLTADDVRWPTWEGEIRSAEEPWFGFGGAWGAVGIMPEQGSVGPAGPGLADPLPGAWPDSGAGAVARCDPGEQHPESAGTGTSCEAVADAPEASRPVRLQVIGCRRDDVAPGFRKRGAEPRGWVEMNRGLAERLGADVLYEVDAGSEPGSHGTFLVGGERASCEGWSWEDVGGDAVRIRGGDGTPAAWWAWGAGDYDIEGACRWIPKARSWLMDKPASERWRGLQRICRAVDEVPTTRQEVGWPHADEVVAYAYRGRDPRYGRVNFLMGIWSPCTPEDCLPFVSSRFGCDPGQLGAERCDAQRDFFFDPRAARTYRMNATTACRDATVRTSPEALTPSGRRRTDNIIKRYPSDEVPMVVDSVAVRGGPYDAGSCGSGDRWFRVRSIWGKPVDGDAWVAASLLFWDSTPAD